jgi:hypothetical protein
MRVPALLSEPARIVLNHRAIILGMKTYPNKQKYHEILKGMSPQEKIEKVFELSDLANAAFFAGLRNRYPQLSDDELKSLYLKKRRACHNQNY